MAWKNLQSYFDVKPSSCKYFPSAVLCFRFITIETQRFIYENYNEFTDLSESVSTNQMAWKSLQSYFNIRHSKCRYFPSAVLRFKFITIETQQLVYDNYNEFTKSTTNLSFFVKLFEYSFKKNSKSNPKDKT